MRKLTPDERLKHGVIVLLKKQDYEDLKRIAGDVDVTQGAWARQFVLRALDRARKLEKINLAAAEEVAERLAEEERLKEEAAKAETARLKAAAKAAKAKPAKEEKVEEVKASSTKAKAAIKEETPVALKKKGAVKKDADKPKGKSGSKSKK